MLDTRFPRPLGDIGHPGSFSVPVRQRVVKGAWPARVVGETATLREAGVLDTFCAQAVELEQAGAAAITTSCGFLVLLQRELQAAVRVPMVTSSLLQLPALLAQERQVGVLTISAEHLGPAHLLAAGVDPERLKDVIVQGVDPGAEFVRAILGNRLDMDLEQARADVVDASRALKARVPALRTVVLECTNMSPYEQAIRDACGFNTRTLFDAPQLHAAFGTRELATSRCP